MNHSAPKPLTQRLPSRPSKSAVHSLLQHPFFCFHSNLLRTDLHSSCILGSLESALHYSSAEIQTRKFTFPIEQPTNDCNYRIQSAQCQLPWALRLARECARTFNRPTGILLLGENRAYGIWLDPVAFALRAQSGSERGRMSSKDRPFNFETHSLIMQQR